MEQTWQTCGLNWQLPLCYLLSQTLSSLNQAMKSISVIEQRFLLRKLPPHQHYRTSHLFLQSVLFAPHNHQDLLKYPSNSKKLKKKMYVKVIPLCSIRSILNTSHRPFSTVFQMSIISPSPLPPRKKERWRVLCNSLKKDIKSKS